MLGKITKSAVDALEKGEFISDAEVKGFVARKLPSGKVTYGLRYRIRGGPQRWLALGLHGDVTADDARRLAKKHIGEVADWRDPAGERQAERKRTKVADADTVNALLDRFLERYANEQHRHPEETHRAFDVYVRPRIGERSIYTLRRSDISQMLGEIADDHGPVMADRVLSRVRTAFNWHAVRDDAFTPPIVRGMAITKPAERARKRVLDDTEIRDVWHALDQAQGPTCYRACIRTLLLTAQRRAEVAQMNWTEVEGNLWIIPASRYKTKVENCVPLTETVFQLLGEPRKRGFVFSTTGGKKALSGFSIAKANLDTAIATLRKAEGRPLMPSWRVHDLRRTARSLMSRAGVSADIAERVLGHKIPGIRGIYDRHEYADEKRDALVRLAAQVAQILAPDPSRLGNVVKTNDTVLSK
jgi:integrase